MTNFIDTVKQFLGVDRASVISSKPSSLDAWSAYEGDFPRPLLPTQIDPRGDDNIILPLVAQIVDTSTAALLGDGIKLDVQGDGDEAAQAWLDQFCTRSRLSTTVQEAALNGAVQGHVFIKVLIVNGVPERFQAINSANVTVATDPRDCKAAISYTIRWDAHNPRTNRTDKYMEVTERNETGGWTIKEFVSRGGSNRYEQIEETDWPFSWSPVFSCVNLVVPRRFWGKSDATEAIIRQNQSINTTLSLLSRLLRNHANPKTMLMGNNGNKNVQWQTDGTICLPEGVTAEQLEMSAAGAGALLELYKTLREALHTTSRTPEVASGKLDNLGAISGTALKILFLPLSQKTAEKRVHLGAMLEEMAMRVLELAGFAGRTVKVVWPDTTPKSDIEERQVALIDQQLGIVSRETIAKNMGYSWEIEQEQMAAETPAPTPNVAL